MVLSTKGIVYIEGCYEDSLRSLESWFGEIGISQDEEEPGSVQNIIRLASNLMPLHL
jgi:hypothetical protein